MTETKTKSSGQIFKLALILFLVAAVVAGVLGLVNYVTKDRIAQYKAEKTALAFSEVLAADNYEELDTELPSGVTGIYKADENGYVVQMNISGAQGMINLVVGVTNEGTVNGVSIIEHAETAGLGAKAAEPDFRNLFIGVSGNVAVDKDGGEIASISGATITSRAVANAVNAAMDAVANLG